VVLDVLPDLRSEASWAPASVEHDDLGALLVTSPQAWAYAALIPVSKRVRKLSQPHLRLGLLVTQGRIGVAALASGTGDLLAEQFVSPTEHPVDVTIELPTQGAGGVILRNAAAEGATHVRVLEINLCDRLP
jgi:hypothetical protein